MSELVLSTRNDHKVREFAGLLPGYAVLALPDEVVLPQETGDTFAANALIKARTAAQATGKTAIADDSGISARALGGAPGVYSARFAGADATDDENLDKLIREVSATDDPHVEYVCVIAYVGADGTEKTFEGRCAGELIFERRGAGGFGYDPAVIPEDYDDRRTMAELTQAEKDAISHRGRAARELLTWLQKL